MIYSCSLWVTWGGYINALFGCLLLFPARINLFSARINTFSALFVLSASSLLCNRKPAAQEAPPETLNRLWAPTALLCAAVATAEENGASVGDVDTLGGQLE